MGRHSCVADAWIREAEEASKLLQQMESNLDNHHNHETIQWKLFELGPKIGRLESLLRNPPTIPILDGILTSISALPYPTCNPRCDFLIVIMQLMNDDVLFPSN
ncbi:hypothetical protein Sjap_007926 [Stephania japonica]|uniref:Uncharacterized protein n=1 Tax=Stephania japonica TaxID=461633 RepID=A0AAP0PAW0_9MAGN